MAKPQRRSTRRSHQWGFIAALALLVLVAIGGWFGWRATHQEQSNLATKSSTNAVSSSNITNSNDPEMFLAWVSNHTDAAELRDAGTRLLAEGHPRAAVICYQRARELKPDDEEACFDLGVAYTQLGQLPEAERYYREALKLFPDYVEAHLNLGNIFTRQKLYAPAMEEFNTALKLSPENASAHNNLGRALAEQGNPMEALNHFSEAARLDTNYVEARFNLGNASLALGRTNEAAAAFEETLRLRPEFAPAARALARLKGTNQ